MSRTACVIWLVGATALHGSPDADSAATRRHIENLGSRAATVRVRAAKALVEIGKPALPELEAAARSDASRTDAVGDVIDQIRWGVDLLPPGGRFEAPDPGLLDVNVFDDFGLAARARRNPLLVEALVRKVRDYHEAAKRPTGESPPQLARELYAIDRLGALDKTPFDEVERRAKELAKRHTRAEERGRIYAAVAHVYGQSGCRPRTVFWAKRALELPIDPVLRLRMYEYWYSATLLRTDPKARRESAGSRREMLRPALFGLREALRYDLPADAPALPSIAKRRDESPESRRLHRRQVQARVVAHFLRDMATLRNIHTDRVAKHATRTRAESEQLRALLERPQTLRALARALREGEELADGLRIAREAKGSP